MDTVDVFSMKDVESLTGIKAHTIRVWEKRYGIPEPKRSGSNIRYFNNDEIRLLLTIRMLNGYGLKISAIAAMSVAERSEHLYSVLEAKGIHHHVHELLLISLLEADEMKFSEVFSSIVFRLGIEQAFIECLLPFFEKVGILWQTGAIEPAQEHFFFHLVRQKLIAATDSLGISTEKSLPAVLLFLPEHELHELGLLFYNYAFRARRFRTYYLGQSVPVEGLERLVRQVKPGIIVTGMTTTLNPLKFPAFSAALAQIGNGAKIFYTGPAFAALKATHKEIKITDDLVRYLKRFPHTKS